MAHDTVTITSVTSLLDSVNIVFANLGEAPLSSLSAEASRSTTETVALATLQEVSNDIQSKGWWFNQLHSGHYDPDAAITIYEINNLSLATASWDTSLPESFVRYVTIRAARIAQSRLIGAEELQKFSYQEELVSLATLQNVHVRNSGSVLDYNDFPNELRGLGINEVFFLQGNIEEKLGTLKLVTEIDQHKKIKAETGLIDAQELKTDAEKLLIDAQELKTDAETALIADQEALVTQQKLTEVEETAKRTSEKALIDAQELKTDAEKLLVDAQATDVAADTTLKGKQGALVDAQELKTDAESALIASQTTTDATQRTLIAAQELKTDAEKLQVDAQTALLTSQELSVDAERDKLEKDTAINLTAEKAFYDGVVAGTQATYRDFAPEMRMMGIQEVIFQQTPAYKKIELISDATKLRTATATATTSDSNSLYEVNKILRLIGESPVTAVNANALASEAFRLLEDTDLELQGRGWWFNTEKDVEFTPTQGRISLTGLIGGVYLSIEPNDYRTRLEQSGSSLYLYDLDKHSFQDWGTKPIKATVIYRRSLSEVHYKYREYLNVRVAILLTELYPQSGIDVQRLPKMEQELRAYFKDRDFDDANYSVFDNYDAAVRIGINRNYDLT